MTKRFSSKDDKELLPDLKRRVDITYRTRINAANRLRDKHNEYKKLNMYYSALVTGVSIISIGMDTYVANISVSNIILMTSIMLTYFMFFVSDQDLQERAYMMEETFKKLDKLGNKICITLEYSESEIPEETCKNFYKEYEAILISIENHEQIDFYRYRLDCFNKRGTNKDGKGEQELYEDIKDKVNKYDKWKKIKKNFKYIGPTTVILIPIVISILKNMKN